MSSAALSAAWRAAMAAWGWDWPLPRRLIELHDGEIGVRSAGEDGHGSTFYFSLPVMPQPELTTRPLNGRREQRAAAAGNLHPTASAWSST